MRRITKVATIAATALTALIATGSAASAAVSYDGSSVGTVDKGDVMRLFSMNEPTFQAKVGEVKFTAKYDMANETRWQCGDGVQSQTSIVHQSRALNVAPIRNESANKVIGFSLNGIDEAKGGTYLSGERVGAPYVGYCPAGGFSGFLGNVFTNTVQPNSVKVSHNGTSFDLPNTPVEVAPVA